VYLAINQRSQKLMLHPKMIDPLDSPRPCTLDPVDLGPWEGWGEERKGKGHNEGAFYDLHFTYEQCAAALGLNSRQRAEQIETDALNKIRERAPELARYLQKEESDGSYRSWQDRYAFIHG